MQKSDSIANLTKALAEFQGKVRQPMKDRDNPFFKSKFVPLENVVEVITETASPLGISFIQYPVSLENRVGMVTVVMHESGEYIQTEPVYARPVKDDPQATGSVITYLKRYSLAAVFGITSDVDDDGNKASEPSTRTEQRTPNFAEVLKDTALKLKRTQQDIYKEVTQSLNINKSTKELTEQEKKAIISQLLKM